jgi:hypothetical protein
VTAELEPAPGGCQGYAQAADSCAAQIADGGSPAAGCVNLAIFDDGYQNLARVFCPDTRASDAGDGG